MTADDGIDALRMEIENLVEQLKVMSERENAHYAEMMQTLMALSDEKVGRDEFAAGDTDDDALYDEARQCVIDMGKASTSFLQRRLGIGYARAARLMDVLEKNGVIGPADGAKPRVVLVADTDEVEDTENNGSLGSH